VKAEGEETLDKERSALEGRKAAEVRRGATRHAAYDRKARAASFCHAQKARRLPPEERTRRRAARQARRHRERVVQALASAATPWRYSSACTLHAGAARADGRHLARYSQAKGHRRSGAHGAHA